MSGESAAWDDYYGDPVEPVDEIGIEVAREFCEACGHYMRDRDSCPYCMDDSSERSGDSA